MRKIPLFVVALLIAMLGIFASGTLPNVDVILFRGLYLIATGAIIYVYALRPAYRPGISAKTTFAVETVTIAMVSVSVGGGAVGLVWTGIGVPLLCAAIFWVLHRQGILVEIRAEALRRKEHSN